MTQSSAQRASGARLRVVVYVDGFNLYYGLRSKGWRRYYWLDLVSLSLRLLRPGQQLVAVRYFTARITGPKNSKAQRQAKYLEALETLSNLKIVYGHFLKKVRKCGNCGAQWTDYEEKMTDVSLATRLLGDAQDDAFDIAMVLSADSDLSSPIEAVLDRHAEKRVVVVFPPDRRSDRLRKVASAAFTVGRKVLKDSQFPQRIIKPDGQVVERPREWK